MIIQITCKIFRRLTSIYYCLKHKQCFKSLGKNVRIYSPLKIQGYQNIVLNDNVHISDNTWLAALPLTGYCASLYIGKSVQIGHFNHIISTKSIIIKDNVLIADKVYISDNIHSYENVNMPIWQQPIKQLNEVIIGENSWIGEHACIIGASIGKHCVIGANSVVTNDIPDFCVAVGAPAKVIKKYNFTTKKWEKVL